MMNSVIDKYEYIKEQLKMYNIDVEKNIYIVDNSYEPRGAIYKYCDIKNNRNFHIYSRVTSDKQALELYDEYLKIIKPIVRKR